jgi:hypothetical protein
LSEIFATEAGVVSQVTLCVTPFHENVTVPPERMSTSLGVKALPFAPTAMSAAVGIEEVTVTCTSAVFESELAVTVAVPFAVPLIVTEAPFGVMFATPVAGNTDHVTA